MRKSKYTTVLPNGENEYIIYNCLNDALLVCTPDTLELIRQHQDHLDTLFQQHPDLYNHLKEKGMIVPDETDETAELIATWEREEESGTHYSITINPTMDCNLRCWYCYEEHLTDSHMSATVLTSIKKLLQRICSNGTTQSLHLSFFGGEPLLEFSSCIKPLITLAHSLCKEYAIELSLSFTTNAVLLSKDKIDFLKATNLPIRFQIPFDGGRDYHNHIKKFANGNPTFDISINNLKHAVEQGFSVIVRCNYTNESISSFNDLIDELADFYKTHTQEMSFAFHQIWQDEHRQETDSIVNQLTLKISKWGKRCFSPKLDSGRCYADQRNSFVINFNGDLYQCTARKFNDENKEGHLQPDGTLIHNQRYEERMQCRFSNPECLECRAFPICKICSQKRLEHDRTRCLISTRAIAEMDALRSRITELYHTPKCTTDCL